MAPEDMPDEQLRWGRWLGLAGVVVGAALVALAWYLRWAPVTKGRSVHPFPLFHLIGVPLVVFGARAIIRNTLVLRRRSRE